MNFIKKKYNISLHFVTALFIILALLSSCSKSAPNAGFVEHPERFAKPETLPFQKGWTKQGVDFKSYRKIMVAPINTQYVLESEWVQKTKNNDKKSVKNK